MDRLGAPDGTPELVAVRTLKMGDLLVAVPAVHALRRAFPAHRLVLAVPGWLEELVDLVGGVDALLPAPGLDGPLDLVPGRADVAVDLHGDGPDSRDVVAALAARRTIGHRGPGTPDGPPWQHGLHERERWARLLRGHGIDADAGDLGLLPPAAAAPRTGATVVHVGAFHGARQWPVDRFAAVVRSLRARGDEVVLTGSAAEADRARAVAAAAGVGADDVLAGTLGLGALAALVHDAALVVTADTGVAHLASAYGVPSVVLFGPARPEEWGPPADGPHVVLTDPRVRRGETFAEDADPALLAVGVDDVLAAADGLRGVAPRRRYPVLPAGRVPSAVPGDR